MVQAHGMEHFKSRREIYNVSVAYIFDTPNENSFYGDKSKRYVIYGSEGDIMQVTTMISSKEKWRLCKLALSMHLSAGTSNPIPRDQIKQGRVMVSW